MPTNCDCSPKSLRVGIPEMSTDEKMSALSAGRFDRFASIGWWDQSVLRDARILVVGAGALGNEVLKNLALLGVGHIAIADFDRIEESNLSRSVLFRSADQGELKAVCAARALRGIYPEIRVNALPVNILAELGLGWFRWAHMVVGALDNREARVFLNSACARVSRPWIDGGIEVLNGIVRGFAPPESACYECTMSERDWQLINRRRSCSLIARRAAEQGGAPTTPTTASVIGAIQAQEVVKFLHGRSTLSGRGFFFEGENHGSYTVQYAIKPDCPWHETPAEIHAVDLGGGSTVATLLAAAERLLGGTPSAIELAREVVSELNCERCACRTAVFRPVQCMAERDLPCPQCGESRVPEFFHSLRPDRRWWDRTLRDIGLPPRDIVWARRDGIEVGIELAGDGLESDI